LPISLQLPGGRDTPRLARLGVVAKLAGVVPDVLLDDVGLIVSELVTNSVRHADVGPAGLVEVLVTKRGDRLRLAVTDPGAAAVPHLVEFDLDEPGGLGLFLVDKLASEWGVVRDRNGVTEVWCEIALPGRLSQPGG
jgi:anti-sigma regulatory factor (Ser/Thr protein kinase)